MTYEFCTSLDTSYLARGLVLYNSLASRCSNFRLRVFCLDDEAKRALDAMRLPFVRTLALTELEEAYPELLEVKAERTLQRQRPSAPYSPADQFAPSRTSRSETATRSVMIE